MIPIFTVRGLVICFEAIMEDLEEHLKALEMPEKCPRLKSNG